ncbi:lysosomal Pro-X carboxypeptidase-like [Pocillopora damicornis]|uniref:lysosomal Pro-X carboxypeptidase-like n=1 Tax=Pocillopora damicornis TaxID=46731 RepID=UPI000F556989|nr:lysosomal Pro-X carboxypeptidase-like [Pocillopora damicornis]
MAAFEDFCRITLLFLVVISASDAFRLRANFPRPQGKDFGLHAKRHLCPFCIYETKTFSQKLDHFGFSDNRTFPQRYLVARKNWVEGGPILFYTGNEGDITWFANNTGFMWDIAGEFKAMLVFAEHRYYGKSLPFGKLSYKGPKYLGYLTSEQALADFAVLIHHIKYWAEIQYGGKKLKAHSNIVFSNGALDPWAAGGVTRNISDSLIAVLIEDGAHHLDLRHKNPLDPPSVVQARNLEKYYISRWIAEAEKKKKDKAKLRISDKGKFRSISIR